MPIARELMSHCDRWVASAERILADGHEASRALAWVERALRMNPTDSRAWVVKARILRALQRVRQALVCLEEAQRLAPSRPETYLERASILLSKNDRGALKEVGMALVRSRRSTVPHFEALCLKGYILANLGRPRGAATSFELALRIRPADALLRWNLGDCYLCLGRTKEAIDSFEEALRIARRGKNVDETALWGHLEGTASELISLRHYHDVVRLLDKGVSLLKKRAYRNDVLSWRELATELVLSHRRK